MMPLLPHTVTCAAPGQPTLLLLHGFSGSGADWAPFVPAWSQTWCVLTVDLPGHGQAAALADPAQYSSAHTAQALVTLLDHLEVAQAHILGYSMGGRLALYLALHHADRVAGLVLESASPGLAAADERQARRISDEHLAAQIEQHGSAWFADYWQEIPLFATQKRLPPDIQAQLHTKRRAAHPAGLAHSLRGMGTGVQPSLWERLGHWTRPVLLIAGALDEKFVAINRRMAAQMPGARLAVVPDAGHTVHLEQPHAFAGYVSDFLTSQTGTNPVQ